MRDLYVDDFVYSHGCQTALGIRYNCQMVLGKVGCQLPCGKNAPLSCFLSVCLLFVGSCPLDQS
jgi:hypothetical protein